MAVTGIPRNLQVLNPRGQHEFLIPSKKIHNEDDVQFWLKSEAYTDIMTFVLQLNFSMFPQTNSSEGQQAVNTVDLETIAQRSRLSPPILSLQELVGKLAAMVEEAPPDAGPQRFGNSSFRKWHQLVESRLPELLDKHVPANVLAFNNPESAEVSPKAEIASYFLGSFGSAQRLDYGTGHELSFLAFIACIWKLGGFPSGVVGVVEREIVAGVIEPYLKLVRKLISTYTLEPAGSHGVWGLDDHAFLPYIFGSAQLSPAATSHDTVPQEGSAPGAPNPSEVTNQKTVDDLRNKNLYFGAIGFIYDVKKGPFWEHSPMLYDISGVSAGWAKINKGMLKMFTVEVLSKFPVVQHFPFGSLFTWEEDQAARQHPSYVQTAKHPKAADTTSAKPPAPASSNVQAQYPTKAPWASTSKPPAPASFSNPESTRVPWAGARPQGFPAATARPLFSSAGAPSAYPAPSTRAPAGTAAPWARAPAAQPPTNPPTGLPTRQSKETQPSPPS